MSRLFTIAFAVFSMICASPSRAEVLVYGIAGTGEASLIEWVWDYVAGTFTPTQTVVGNGNFTATYRVNLATLPSNMPVGTAYAGYNSIGGAPVFMSSVSNAMIAGEQFGLTTDGTDASVLASADGMFGADILIDAGRRISSSNPLRTFHANGAVATETSTDIYNQFFAFAPFGPSSVTVGGVQVPDFARGGSIQMINGKTVTSFDDMGNRVGMIFTQRQFLGNGNATLSLLAGVPEPATWAMMILGFGMAGAAMRRRRKPLPA